MSNTAYFDDYFGSCPICHKTNGYLNTGRSHWFFCDEHRTRWCVGSNLFDSWRNQTEDEQRALYDAKGFGTYEEVEPSYKPTLPPTISLLVAVSEHGLELVGTPFKLDDATFAELERCLGTVSDETVKGLLRRLVDIGEDAERAYAEGARADADYDALFGALFGGDAPAVDAGGGALGAVDDAGIPW